MGLEAITRTQCRAYPGSPARTGAAPAALAAEQLAKASFPLLPIALCRREAEVLADWARWQ